MRIETCETTTMHSAQGAMGGDARHDVIDERGRDRNAGGTYGTVMRCGNNKRYVLR